MMSITSPIFENEVATLSGQVVDPGTLDTFTLDVSADAPGLLQEKLELTVLSDVNIDTEQQIVLGSAQLDTTSQLIVHGNAAALFVGQISAT